MKKKQRQRKIKEKKEVGMSWPAFFFFFSFIFASCLSRAKNGVRMKHIDTIQAKKIMSATEK